MRKVSGYFVTMPTGWQNGSIPAPIFERVYGFMGYLQDNSLPLISIVLAFVGLVGVI